MKNHNKTLSHQFNKDYVRFNTHANIEHVMNGGIYGMIRTINQTK